MYEAPDRYKRLISARLPGGELAGLAASQADDESSPLRDVQLISRAQLAPFFAAANIVAALMMVANLWGLCRRRPVCRGSGAVARRQFRRDAARAHAIDQLRRPLRAGGCPRWLMVGEVLVRAGVWLSIPLYCFPSLDPGTQVIAASLMAGLGIGALGPGRRSALRHGVDGRLHRRASAARCCIGRHTVPVPAHALDRVHAWALRSSACLTVARWAFHQLKTNADVGSQSESASLLLQEYEQRGVGWLWQVDGENRVTYISSRMSALLGKPASQLIGHSLPALLGGHAELGRVLLEKQPFNALEMELKTPRGPRWISIAGDPIVDTAGRFEGFRGVGSRHHRDPPDAGAADPPRQRRRAVRPAQPRPRPPAARRGAARRDRRQCAVRDHVPRPRRLQAGQRHLRPPEGRRRASRRRQAPGRRGRRRWPCRPHGRRRVRDRHHRRAEPQEGRAARRPHHRRDQGALS